MLKGVNTKSSLIQKGAQKEEDQETDWTNKNEYQDGKIKLNHINN